jgi:hypothetical protein
MGRAVQLKFLKRPDELSHRIATNDMSVGKTYSAYLPDEGERDKDGLAVSYKDECWIHEDDVGDQVVTRLLDHLIVED